MTDQRLIKALRRCGSRIENCNGCFLYENCRRTNCIVPAIPAADRLEALLAENEHLREVAKMASKWVSVDERLPELTEMDKYWIKQLGMEVAPEFIVIVKGALIPSVLRFDGKKWRDDNGTWYRVEYWCRLPKPPSTEDDPTGQKG